MRLRPCPRAIVGALLALVGGSASVSGVGCGVDTPADLTAQTGGCAVYVPPATALLDASAPISFTNDVLPLVNRSCAYTSCHGSLGDPTGGLYLGLDTTRTYDGLVGVASNALPSMARVKAGDPANSFLQHEIDGDACTLPACSGTCADSMPQGQDLMAVTDRLVFRTWIAQGAVADFALGDGG